MIFIEKSDKVIVTKTRPSNECGPGQKVRDGLRGGGDARLPHFSFLSL